MEKENRGFLEHISPLLKDALLDRGQTFRLKKGSVLFDEKEAAPIFIILEGFIALQRISRTKDIRMLLICGAGEVANELVLENGLSGVEGVALSEVTVLSVDQKLYDQLSMEFSELSKAMYISLARKSRRLYHQLGNDYSTYQINNHLYVKIWKLARDYGIDEAGGRRIPFDISVVMLAQLLGAKRETVSREVSKLREKGMIEMENGKLFVRDMDQLREEMKSY